MSDLPDLSMTIDMSPTVFSVECSLCGSSFMREADETGLAPPVVHGCRTGSWTVQWPDS